MSLQQQITTHIVKQSLRASFKFTSTLPLPVSALRTGMELGASLFPVNQQVGVNRTVIGGVAAELVSSQPQSKQVILHCHGGAFFTGSAKTHRALASDLSVLSGADVYMLDYRLAPEHPYPAALDDAYSAYMALLDKGYQAQQIILAGDSGGCAHILNLALRLREQGQALPAGLAMISPFVDLTLSMPSVVRHKRLDPMVTAHALKRGADAYRGQIAANDRRVSPLFADLTGLPPLLIQVGEQEILLDDALALERIARAAGVEVTCEVYESMWHNFQMFSQFVHKADFALQQIGRFVKRCA